MDHRIAKDMISSGMIPSGEKKKEDLGRPQYGTVPSPNALADAYKSMYDKKEEVINEHHQKDKDGNTIPHENEEINEIAPLAAIAPMLGKVAAIAGKGAAAAAKTGVKVGAKLGGKTGANLMKSVARNPMGAIDNINRVGYAAQTVGNMMPKPGVPAVTKKQSQGGMISADADLFDIVKGQLLDEGLSEEEIKDIMLTLTPDEILKEIEESSMSAGSSGGHYSDGGDGVFRSKEQVARQFNKNFPPAKNGKVDKPTRKAINTSAKDFGIQGPSTLKQSVEPEGETI